MLNLRAASPWVVRQQRAASDIYIQRQTTIGLRQLRCIDRLGPRSVAGRSEGRGQELDVLAIVLHVLALKLTDVYIDRLRLFHQRTISREI